MKKLFKFLETTKVSKGYYVRIAESCEAETEREVLDLIKQNGLKVNMESSTKERIYAE